MSPDQTDTTPIPTNALSDFEIAFGEVVAARRKEMGLSQRAFSRRGLFDNPHLRQIERGERNVTLLTLLKLSTAFGVRPSTLLKDAEDRLGWY